MTNDSHLYKVIIARFCIITILKLGITLIFSSPAKGRWRGIARRRGDLHFASLSGIMDTWKQLLRHCLGYRLYCPLSSLLVFFSSHQAPA